MPRVRAAAPLWGLAAAILVAATARAQCPDGMPPPCTSLRGLPRFDRLASACPAVERAP
jgi:hypothetical protein